MDQSESLVSAVSTVFFIGLYALIFTGFFIKRQVWTICESVGYGIMGLQMVFWPKCTDFAAIGQQDSLHYFMWRAFGWICFSQAFGRFLSRGSSDNKQFGSRLFVLLIGVIILEILAFVMIFQTKDRKSGLRPSESAFTMEVSHTVLAVTVLSCQLARNKDIGGAFSFQDNLISKGLLLDFFLNLIKGVMHLVAPMMILKFIAPDRRIDIYHLTEFRYLGVLCLIDGLNSLMAAGFSLNEDKKAHISGRLMTLFGMILMLTYGQFKVFVLSQPLYFTILLTLLGYSAFLAYLYNLVDKKVK